MKRVIYVLTLALILLGLIVPAVSHAGNSERSKILAYSTQDERVEPAFQHKPVLSDVQTGWTLHSFLGTVFQALNWPVHELYVHGPTAKTDNQATELDRPLFVQRPDWWWQLEKSDRPDTDEDGWQDQKK